MTSRRIEDDDGNFITFSAAAIIVKTAFMTIQRWHNVEGLKTIRELIERNENRIGYREKAADAISHGKSIFHVIDKKGFVYTTRDIANKLDISVASARDYIVRCGCKTLQDCLDRKSNMDTRVSPKNGKPRPKKKYKKRTSLTPVAEYVQPIKKGEFIAKTTHCITDGIGCENYTYCQDYRLRHKKHGPKFKASGCYSKPKKENHLHTNSNHGGESPLYRSRAHGGLSE